MDGAARFEPTTTTLPVSYLKPSKPLFFQEILAESGVEKCAKLEF
jgi:hypothetical protein